ncbi:ribonuclease E inhibitor RraB [Neisseria dentiae]|uniref:ribonuclease E inhibitor RraB n=1 Tax=Neisseria dentiae TaxID=194197 RepID=UPI00359F5AFB
MIIDEKSTLDILKHYQNLGFDLNKSMVIDFFIEGSKKNLQSIESQIVSYRQDFKTSIERNENRETWTCYCTINIIPTLEEILEIEKKTSDIAQKNQCTYEGFGSYGN